MVERHRGGDGHHEEVDGAADQARRGPAGVHRGEEDDAPDDVGEDEADGEDHEGADEPRHEGHDLGPQRLQRLEAERVEPGEEEAQEEDPEDGGGGEALRGGQLGLAEELRGAGPLREAGDAQPAERPPDDRARERGDQPARPPPR